MLTIGMATYKDYDGVYFTVQGLRLFHDMRDTEIIVVDNAPGSPQSQTIQEFLHWIRDIPCRYIPMAEPTGTAQPRNRIFAEAQGDTVLCLDSHVLLQPGSLAQLRRYFAVHPESMDLIQGPMLYDDLTQYADHFADIWRGEMWGTWETAWRCPCGKTVFVPALWSSGYPTTTTPAPNNPGGYLLGLGLDGKTLPDPLPCGCSLAFVGDLSDLHGRVQQTLFDKGCRPACDNTNPFRSYPDPYPIPAMGLGAFACRKAAWLGFHPDFRGFGGEEWYIHEKFRQAGRQALCLPGFRWLHRFGRPSGVEYPLTRKDKIRNYILAHQELKIPLDRCRRHFVEDIGVSPEEFDDIMARVKEPAAGGCGCSGEQPAGQVQGQSPAQSQGQSSAQAGTHPAWSDPAVGLLQQVARGFENGIHFADTMGAAAHALSLELSGSLQACSLATQHNGQAKKQRPGKGSLPIAIEKADVRSRPARGCDLLVIDQDLTADELYQALQTHGRLCSGRILLGGTLTRGESNKDQPGILPAVRRYVGENPQWTVLDHHKVGSGWLVLTRKKEDKKPLPPLYRRVWNFTRALFRSGVKVAGRTGPLLNTWKQELRLAECAVCPSRNDQHCGECGCPLKNKTSFPNEFCPLGKWSALPESSAPQEGSP